MNHTYIQDIRNQPTLQVMLALMVSMALSSMQCRKLRASDRVSAGQAEPAKHESRGSHSRQPDQQNTMQQMQYMNVPHHGMHTDRTCTSMITSLMERSYSLKKQYSAGFL